MKDWYKKLDVDMIVEVGRGRKTIEEIRNWRKGITIQLEDSNSGFLNVFLNNKLFGEGEVLKRTTGEMDLMIKKKHMREEEVISEAKNNDMR